LAVQQQLKCATVAEHAAVDRSVEHRSFVNIGQRASERQSGEAGEFVAADTAAA
jgi:hypothetical protein